MIADMLPWIVAAVSLTALLASVVVMVRGQRQLRMAHDESIAAKNEQISSLETQISSLRGSESVRFVDRYVAAKNGLEERIVDLQERLESTHAQEEALRGQLNDLGLTEREREVEAARLHRDLNRATDQIRRLELILREAVSVGPMDVEPIRTELEARRELSVHIRERLDRLSLQEQDRLATRRTLAHRLERLKEEAGRIRRDVEITRAAVSITDGILGIDGETRKRLARHASEHLDSALESLGDGDTEAPIARFVEILEQQRPRRLLERGRTPPSADSARDEEEAPRTPAPPQAAEVSHGTAEAEPQHPPQPYPSPVP